MHRVRISVFFAAALILAPLAFAHAQAAPSGDESLSCPEYTSGGSVALSLSTELTSTVASVPVGVHATVQNISGNQIYDGTLFARVTNVSGESPIVVDEFVAVNEIDLALGETKEELFVWKVPPRATSGDYRVEVFFVYPRSLFIPPPGTVPQDVATLTMRVESELREVVRIDRAQMKVSGAEYRPGSAAYTYQKNAPISVSIPVVNDTDAPYKGAITWRLYMRGKGPLSKPIAEYREAVETHPHTMVEKSYTLPQTSGASYYLEADLSDGMSRSLVSILLLRDGVCAQPAPQETPRNTRLWIVLFVLAAAVIGFAIMGRWTKP